MSCSERLLLWLSRDPADSDFIVNHYEARHEDHNVAAANIENMFPPQYRDEIVGKNILDVGCADGHEPLALKSLGASEVVGIDICMKRNNIEVDGVVLRTMDASRMRFSDGSFDVVVTIDALEHFRDPEAVLRECMRVTKPGGVILITASIWYGPWGSHMHFFCRLPWLNILFSERTIMNVRRLFRNDGASRYCEVEGGLNNITIRKFRSMCRRLGAHIECFKLDPIKDIQILGRIPFVSELLCHGFTAAIRKSKDKSDSFRADPSNVG